MMANRETREMCNEITKSVEGIAHGNAQINREEIFRRFMANNSEKETPLFVFASHLVRIDLEIRLEELKQKYNIELERDIENGFSYGCYEFRYDSANRLHICDTICEKKHKFLVDKLISVNNLPVVFLIRLSRRSRGVRCNSFTTQVESIERGIKPLKEYYDVYDNIKDISCVLIVPYEKLKAQTDEKSPLYNFVNKQGGLVIPTPLFKSRNDMKEQIKGLAECCGIKLKETYQHQNLYK